MQSSLSSALNPLLAVSMDSLAEKKKKSAKLVKASHQPDHVTPPASPAFIPVTVFLIQMHLRDAARMKSIPLLAESWGPSGEALRPSKLR